MTLVRVYLPMSPAQVRALASTRSIGPVPLTAYAVTPELRSAYPQEDQDGWEYHALQAAAAAIGSPGVRAAVAAADVEDSGVEDPRNAAAAAHAAQVEVRRQVGLNRVASFHLAEHPGPVGEQDDLLWYDVTELHTVLSLVDTSAS